MTSIDLVLRIRSCAVTRILLRRLLYQPLVRFLSSSHLIALTVYVMLGYVTPQWLFSWSRGFCCLRKFYSGFSRWNPSTLSIPRSLLFPGSWFSCFWFLSQPPSFLSVQFQDAGFEVKSSMCWLKKRAKVWHHQNAPLCVCQWSLNNMYDITQYMP